MITSATAAGWPGSSAAAPKGGLREGLIERGRTPMTPLALFLLGCATVFLGTVQAAFSALMRLSLRLMAERGGRSDRLGHYLDDPLQLFIPVRILIGVVHGAGRRAHRAVSDIHDARRSPCSSCRSSRSWWSASTCCRWLIVRRDPEEVLDVLLPVFHADRAACCMPFTRSSWSMCWAAREREREHGGRTAPRRRRRTAAESRAAENDDLRGGRARAAAVDRRLHRDGGARSDDAAPRHRGRPVDATLQDLRALFREEQYSRMPVYRDNLDNILGIVFVKDLVALPPGAEPPLTTLMRSAYFVPESKRVSELLKEMQRRQVQMAIVVDEYGGTAGLVTVEDLLEEIVGEIRDEYDVESETVTDEGDGVVRLQRQGQRRRSARPPRRRDRARRVRDRRRLPAVAPRPHAVRRRVVRHRRAGVRGARGRAAPDHQGPRPRRGRGATSEPPLGRLRTQ